MTACTKARNVLARLAAEKDRRLVNEALAFLSRYASGRAVPMTHWRCCSDKTLGAATALADAAGLADGTDYLVVRSSLDPQVSQLRWSNPGAAEMLEALAPPASDPPSVYFGVASAKDAAKALDELWPVADGADAGGQGEPQPERPAGTDFDELVLGAQGRVFDFFNDEYQEDLPCQPEDWLAGVGTRIPPLALLEQYAIARGVAAPVVGGIFDMEWDRLPHSRIARAVDRGDKAPVALSSMFPVDRLTLGEESSFNGYMTGGGGTSAAFGRGDGLWVREDAAIRFWDANVATFALDAKAMAEYVERIVSTAYNVKCAVLPQTRLAVDNTFYDGGLPGCADVDDDDDNSPAPILYMVNYVVSDRAVSSVGTDERWARNKPRPLSTENRDLAAYADTAMTREDLVAQWFMMTHDVPLEPPEGGDAVRLDAFRKAAAKAVADPATCDCALNAALTKPVDGLGMFYSPAGSLAMGAVAALRWGRVRGLHTLPLVAGAETIVARVVSFVTRCEYDLSSQLQKCALTALYKDPTTQLAMTGGQTSRTWYGVAVQTNVDADKFTPESGGTTLQILRAAFANALYGGTNPLSALHFAVDGQEDALPDEMPLAHKVHDEALARECLDAAMDAEKTLLPGSARRTLGCVHTSSFCGSDGRLVLVAAASSIPAVWTAFASWRAAHGLPLMTADDLASARPGFNVAWGSQWRDRYTNGGERVMLSEAWFGSSYDRGQCWGGTTEAMQTRPWCGAYGVMWRPADCNGAPIAPTEALTRAAADEFMAEETSFEEAIAASCEEAIAAS